MIGELAVSFCGRKAGETSLCIDLWSYEDGSCNLVVSTAVGATEHELVFPCAPHQLDAVLSGKALFVKNTEGSILIEKCGDTVCAEYVSLRSGRNVKQCLPFEEFERGVNSLLSGTIGYLA